MYRGRPHTTGIRSHHTNQNNVELNWNMNNNKSASSFLENLHECQFVSDSLLDDGDACRDLFLVNSAKQTASTHLTTGCLPVFADEVVGAKHSFPMALTGTTSASGEAVADEKKPSASRKKKSKRPLFEAPVYAPISVEEAFVEVTTRSGRLSKRPNMIVVADDIYPPGGEE